jgi:hypothetical protein
MNWRAGKGTAIEPKFPLQGNVSREMSQSHLQECLDTPSPLI